MPPRSRLGFREEMQNYAKRNRNQILTCFVYRITSVIINQRFLQIVESIIIRLISDKKRKRYYKMSLCFVCCLSITGNSAGLALTKLQNNHAKNIGEQVYGLLSQHVLRVRPLFLCSCIKLFSFQYLLEYNFHYQQVIGLL